MPARANALVSGRLLERTKELAQIDQLVEAAHGGTGGLLLISGPAGIGKTSLLAACAEGASSRAMATFSVRGDELAMDSSFSAVRELFARVHREGDIAGHVARRIGEAVLEIGVQRQIGGVGQG